MAVSRRSFLGYAALAGMATDLALPLSARAAQPLPRGGTLVIGSGPEATSGLTSAITSAGTAQLVSGKIFDGLLTFDEQFNPKPQLATRWEAARDGLSLTFHLRPNVRWHDGQPFTSKDVAYSVLEIWKKYHSRGRTTFANVIAVDTPDALTATLRLIKPAPYLLSALMSSVEAQILPQHLYAGRDVLSNPLNNAPVGNGPFKFVKWEQGNYVLLERNPDYWDAPRPYVDKVLFRFIADRSGGASALETGEVHLADNYGVALTDIVRLSRNPQIVVKDYPSTYITGTAAFEFNLDRPQFRDPRVRQAFAHAFDRDFIVKNIWLGYADKVEAPIPKAFPAFFTADVPTYPLDLAKAEALLDAAGLKRDAKGVRLTLTNDPAPTGPLAPIAQHLRSNLQKIGVRLNIRSSDFGEFVNRVYTRRDFDTIIYSANAGPDPAIGTQRFYWSKNFKPGVAFSNAADYNSPEVDQLLESGQAEIDPARRRDIYNRFQQKVQTDVARIPLISPHVVTLARREVLNFGGNQALYANLANVALDKKPA
ncbi:extracellular solute-binding protein [Caballeronia sordidicola]|uniref:Extracellular solute-binding protein n=1 Tax=Caballeronia sordidicola TaxID=196367 RepID=A0A158II37_CABSO|nr:ABC transporter substrate-binding protein [Caballeronia sordidicola]SAL55690.1 extracellular solute-binding protein [Caballeronia sordidicola]